MVDGEAPNDNDAVGVSVAVELGEAPTVRLPLGLAVELGGAPTVRDAVVLGVLVSVTVPVTVGDGVAPQERELDGDAVRLRDDVKEAEEPNVAESLGVLLKLGVSLAVRVLLRVLVLVLAGDLVRLVVVDVVGEEVAPKLLLPVGVALPASLALSLGVAVVLTRVAEGVHDGLAPKERLLVGDALAVNNVGVTEAVRLRGRRTGVSVREPLKVPEGDPVPDGVRLSDPGDRVPVLLGVRLSEPVREAERLRELD